MGSYVLKRVIITEITKKIQCCRIKLTCGKKKKKRKLLLTALKLRTQSGSFGHVKTRAKKNLGKGKIGKKGCVSGKESLLRLHHDKERMMKQMFLQMNKENLHLPFRSAFLSLKMPSGKESLPRLHHDKEKMLEEKFNKSEQKKPLSPPSKCISFSKDGKKSHGTTYEKPEMHLETFV